MGRECYLLSYKGFMFHFFVCDVGFFFFPVQKFWIYLRAHILKVMSKPIRDSSDK